MKSNPFSLKLELGPAGERFSFSGLLKLEHLDIGENLLQYFPGNLEDLINLKYIDFSFNRLRRLPEYMKSEDLETLILDGNELYDQTELPTWIVKLNKCRTLSLAGAWLKELVDVFKAGVCLNNLLWLDLKSSNIDMIPVSLLNLEKLERLQVGNCHTVRDTTTKQFHRIHCSYEVVAKRSRILEIFKYLFSPSIQHFISQYVLSIYWEFPLFLISLSLARILTPSNTHFLSLYTFSILLIRIHFLFFYTFSILLRILSASNTHFLSF